MNKKKVMICTDIAARGFDFKGVELVINFQFPIDTEKYVHRIGRAGRRGRKGRAVTFIDSRNSRSEVIRLIKLLEKEKMTVPKELRIAVQRLDNNFL